MYRRLQGGEACPIKKSVGSGRQSIFLEWKDKDTKPRKSTINSGAAAPINGGVF